MTKTLVSSALCSMLLCACNNAPRHTEGERAAPGDARKLPSPDIELTTASPPPSVVGCSCLLAENAMQYRNQQFLYTEKFGTPTGEDFAFVFINGDPVRLQIRDLQIDDDSGNRKAVYMNSDYEVTVDLHMSRRADHEVMVQTGTLALETRRGEILEKNVHGVCGC